MQLFVASDHHFGDALDAPEALDRIETSVRTFVEDLKMAHRAGPVEVVLNGDVFSVHTVRMFDPTLARRQIRPLTDFLMATGVPVTYVSGNNDHWNLGDESEIRTLFNDPERKLNLTIAGLKHEHENILFIHGHIVEPSPLTLARAVLKLPFQRAIDRLGQRMPAIFGAHHERTSERRMHVLNYRLSQAKDALLHLAPGLRARADRTIDRIVEDVFTRSLIAGAHALRAHGKNFDTIVIGHTHKPAVLAASDLQSIAPSSMDHNLHWIVNTGTATGSLRSIATYAILAPDKKPQVHTAWER